MAGRIEVVRTAAINHATFLILPYITPLLLLRESKVEEEDGQALSLNLSEFPSIFQSVRPMD